MAVMHPSDIAKRKHVKSEEDFFNACRDQLSEKYHVFFSVRWYSEENGKRIDSECDFLIFNPDYGFLCIECKGGKGIYVDDDDTWFLKEYDEDRKLRYSPYKQAEESMRFFKRYYEDELETAYPGIYGNAVAFPKFAVSEPITVESPLALTIDIEDMGNLQSRIVEIFRYFNVKRGGHASFMSPDTQKKFISLINKRVALSVAAGALIEDKERELVEINQTQDVVIDLLMHYPRAFVIGGAGTGKTWIGIKKIKRCILSGKHPLYLCYNATLAARVKEHIGMDGADIYSIDKFAETILGAAYETAPIVNGCKEYANLLEQLPVLQQYDLVIVDEAQDFTEDWAYCANLLVKEKGSLYVFYDESQNIFSRDFGDKFFIDGEPFVLRYNIRNTSNIYQYTLERTALGTDTLVNQIEGVEPDVRKLTRRQAVISFVDSVVNKLVNKEGVSPEKIVILSNQRLDQSVLDGVNYIGGYPLTPLSKTIPGGVIFAPVEDFKGLESDIVIFINHTYKGEAKTEDIRAIQYTALTRARFYLYVIDYERTL
ncbi:ATP-binding domain-containing protein [Clostridiales bacterium]